MATLRPAAGTGLTLGDFLVARRATVDPTPVDGPTLRHRRVTGLRREEVAVRAGVSVDYYTRLEQGRELHPSAQVLEGLSRALCLDSDARDHLYRLAGTLPANRGFISSDTVSPELLQLVESIDHAPAMVHNQRLDMLARNPLAVALHCGFVLGDNCARMIFLDGHGKSFYADWDRTAEIVVAGLRLAAGQTPQDQALTALIDELSSGSPEFCDLWARQIVRAKTNELKRYIHPIIGPVMLMYQAFDVRNAPGQQLIVMQPERGTDAVEQVEQLRVIAVRLNSSSSGDLA